MGSRNYPHIGRVLRSWRNSIVALIPQMPRFTNPTKQVDVEKILAVGLILQTVENTHCTQDPLLSRLVSISTIADAEIWYNP